MHYYFVYVQIKIKTINLEKKLDKILFIVTIIFRLNFSRFRNLVAVKTSFNKLNRYFVFELLIAKIFLRIDFHRLSKIIL